MKARANYNYWMGSITIIILSLLFQNIILFQIGPIAVRLFHVTPLLLLPTFFPIRKYKLPPLPLIVFGATVLLSSAFAAPSMGISSTVLSWILGFYLIIAILNLSDDIISRIPCILTFSIAVFLLWIIVKMVIYREAILTFPFTQGDVFHPSIPCAFAGGNNLEASWFALLGVFTYKHSKGAAFYMSVAFLYSMLCASRSGLLACCIILVWILIRNKKRIEIAVLIMAMIGVGYFSYYNLPAKIDSMDIEFIENNETETAEEISNTQNRVFGSPLFTTEGGVPYESRLETIGSDPGSRGRLKMWEKVPEAVTTRPWGYGLGNSTKALNCFLQEGEEPIPEDNVHNLYLEFLVTGGFLSQFMFIGLVLYFAVVNLKDHCVRNPYAAFVGAYLLLGMIQFKGTDMMMFFGLSLWLSTFYKEMSMKKMSKKTLKET